MFDVVLPAVGRGEGRNFYCRHRTTGRESFAIFQAVQYPNELVRIRKTSLSLFGLCPALYHFKLRQFLQNVLPPTEDSPLEMVRMNENEQFAAWRANRLKEIAALRQDKGYHCIKVRRL